ncbi:MAG: hypothetical protein ACXVPQ_09730 [Bacteroidia bacterium]
MKKLTGLFILFISLTACNDVAKLDKQLYDSTEVTAPITKMDQLNEIDKQSAAADSAANVKDTPHKQH